MPINNERVVEIIFKNISEIEERYQGYSDDLKQLVAEVMVLERDHQIQKTNIKQLMSEKIALSANELFEKLK
jgi:hypothetical protein